MTPEDYDAWYGTARGAWIGAVECRVLADLLEMRPGESLLDVGCGTGHFTRCLGERAGRVVGVDIDADMLRYAARRGPPGVAWVRADAVSLPFPDRSFDVVASVTALCFVADERRAVAEMLRVARRRVALGLLNRRSLLYLQKGRGGGSGAYRGARWHSCAEARALFSSMGVGKVRTRTAVVLPSGSRWAQGAERRLRGTGAGAFIAVSADCAA